MARAAAPPERKPRGTNIIIKAFMEATKNQPPQWQKLAAQAALQELTGTVKSMPTWQDPKGMGTIKSTSTTSTRSGTSRSAGTTTRNSSAVRGSSRGGRGARSQRSETTLLNSGSHPEQQS